MNIEIANRLVQLRKQHGLSQEELAARLGLSRQAVSKWERAEASPDTDNLILLSRVYGVSIDELLRTEDPVPEPEPEKGVKVTINGKPVRFHAKDGFYFSVGDEEDEAALLRGDTKGKRKMQNTAASAMALRRMRTRTANRFCRRSHIRFSLRFSICAWALPLSFGIRAGLCFSRFPSIIPS